MSFAILSSVLSEDSYAALLGAEAPVKVCGCGRAHTAAGWAQLELCGRMPDGEGGTLEFRTCTCLSTITIQVGR